MTRFNEPTAALLVSLFIVHLLHGLGLVRVVVLGHLEAEEGPPVGVELAGLGRVPRLERRPPVVQEPRPVYDHEALDVVERPLTRRDQHLLVLGEAREVRVQDSHPLHLRAQTS